MPTYSELIAAIMWNAQKHDLTGEARYYNNARELDEQLEDRFPVKRDWYIAL